MLTRQIQKEIWRIQDVMEGLRKNNPSRGTDTAKHRGGYFSAGPLQRTPSTLVPFLALALCSEPVRAFSGSQVFPWTLGCQVGFP